MSALIAFCAAHKTEVIEALVALLALSETLPFVKGTPAGGLIHGLVVLLKKGASQC